MRFLLATDGSEHSENAARLLGSLALTAKDEVIIMHVVSDIPFDDDYHQQIRHVIRKVAPKILRHSVDILKPSGASLAVKEIEGMPETIIPDVAADCGADMIVMGARGIRGIKSFFLGSVTRAVTAASNKPVLVAKTARQNRSGPVRVLLAADGSPASLVSAEVLSRMPFRKDTELTIITFAWSEFADIPDRYSIEIDSGIKKSIARAREVQAKAAEKIIDEVQRNLSRKFRKIHATVRGGNPASGILKEAKESEADIIAVGSRGLKGLKGMLDSVSKRVLDHAGAAVLVCKSQTKNP